MTKFINSNVLRHVLWLDNAGCCQDRRTSQCSRGPLYVLRTTYATTKVVRFTSHDDYSGQRVHVPALNVGTCTMHASELNPIAIIP